MIEVLEPKGTSLLTVRVLKHRLFLPFFPPYIARLWISIDLSLDKIASRQNEMQAKNKFMEEYNGTENYRIERNAY